MIGTLYIVATPIGNLDDLSRRARDTLNSVALIACEDTRRTRKLLSHYGIETATISYHEHNEEERATQLLQHLESGRDLALVSDAGTPLLSDPGYRLVHACRERSYPVFSIPGPFAAAAALSVSGLPSDRMLFVGFLNARQSVAERQLSELSGCPATLVFYLSPHRLQSTLSIIQRVLGERRAFLIREMTKVYEESYSGTLSEILKLLGDHGPKGEYTLVVEGPRRKMKSLSEAEVLTHVKRLMSEQQLSQKEAIRKAASDLGLPKRKVYQLVIRS